LLVMDGMSVVELMRITVDDFAQRICLWCYGKVGCGVMCRTVEKM
jgi:hypothetical protein